MWHSELPETRSESANLRSIAVLVLFASALAAFVAFTYVGRNVAAHQLTRSSIDKIASNAANAPAFGVASDVAHTIEFGGVEVSGVELDVTTLHVSTAQAPLVNMLSPIDIICAQHCPDMRNWYQDWLDGAGARQDIHVTFVSTEEWDFYNCFPVERSYLVGGSGKTAPEVYSVQCDRFELLTFP